jgi:hypothetical protein
MNFFGSVEVVAVHLRLHLDEPSRLYGDRDFAVGQTSWRDAVGEERVFQERWVRDGRNWYTRAVGFVSPSVIRPAVGNEGEQNGGEG